MACRLCGRDALILAYHPALAEPVPICAVQRCGAQLIGPKRAAEADESASKRVLGPGAAEEDENPERAALERDIDQQLTQLEQAVDILGRQTVRPSGLTAPPEWDAARRRSYEWRAVRLDHQAVYASWLNMSTYLRQLDGILARRDGDRLVSEPMTAVNSATITDLLKTMRTELRDIRATYAGRLTELRRDDLQVLAGLLMQMFRTYNGQVGQWAVEREYLQFGPDESKQPLTMLPAEVRQHAAGMTLAFPFVPLTAKLDQKLRLFEKRTRAGVPKPYTSVTWACADSQGDIYLYTDRVEGIINDEAVSLDTITTFTAASEYTQRQTHVIDMDMRLMNKFAPVRPRFLLTLPYVGDDEDGAGFATILLPPAAVPGTHVNAHEVAPEHYPSPPMSDDHRNVAVFTNTVTADGCMYSLLTTDTNVVGLYQYRLDNLVAPTSVILHGPLATPDIEPYDSAMPADDPMNRLYLTYVRVAVSDAVGGGHYVAVTGIGRRATSRGDVSTITVYHVDAGIATVLYTAKNKAAPGDAVDMGCRVDKTGSVMCVSLSHDQFPDTPEPNALQISVFARNPTHRYNIYELERTNIDVIDFLCIEADERGRKMLLFFISRALTPSKYRHYIMRIGVP